MSEAIDPVVGSITWRDLTVPDAGAVRDFYQAVVGWEFQETPMGDYSDYCMVAPGTGEVVAGVCHARGENIGVPAQWLMYITVADADASAQRCVELGGEILHGPRQIGDARFCVIRDPAGAVCALYAP
jgi:predicted enzyme related to lactoylglutathione lyase